MRKSINFLMLVSLAGAAFSFQKNSELFLLLFSLGMGLIALTELDVDWNEKISFKDYVASLRTRTYPISLAAKIAGWRSRYRNCLPSR